MIYQQNNSRLPVEKRAVEITLFSLAFAEQFINIMFTKRELEVLNLIAGGYSTQAIAQHLCRTTETIKSHRKNIRVKAQEGGENISSLSVFAIKYIKTLAELSEKSP